MKKLHASPDKETESILSQRAYRIVNHPSPSQGASTGNSNKGSWHSEEGALQEPLYRQLFYDPCCCLPCSENLHDLLGHVHSYAAVSRAMGSSFLQLIVDHRKLQGLFERVFSPFKLSFPNLFLYQLQDFLYWLPSKHLLQYHESKVQIQIPLYKF